MNTRQRLALYVTAGMAGHTLLLSENQPWATIAFLVFVGALGLLVEWDR